MYFIKSALTQPHRYKPELNKGFNLLHFIIGHAVLATRIWNPKGKALIENALRLVYQRICFALKEQVFLDHHSMNQAIKPLLYLHNARMYQQRQTSRTQLFLEQEKLLAISIASTAV